MNFFCSHDRAHSLDEAHHGHWEFNHSVPRRCGNLKSSWSDLTEPDTQYGCHFSWDTTFREVDAFLGYKKLLLGETWFFFGIQKTFFGIQKTFFGIQKTFRWETFFVIQKTFLEYKKLFGDAEAFFRMQKENVGKNPKKNITKSTTILNSLFFTNVAVGAQLYDPCLLEIVARRPVYVRLALWFLHPPAWVEGHTGGSRLTPTVHPCPVQLGRLWVAYVVYEPNEPQEHAQLAHDSGARVQDHDPGTSQPAQTTAQWNHWHRSWLLQNRYRDIQPHSSRASHYQCFALTESTLLLHSRDAGECHVGRTLR